MKSKRTTILLIISILTTTVVIMSFVFFLRIIKNKNEHTSVVIATLEEKMTQKENATIFAEKVEEIKSLNNLISARFIDPNKIDEFVSYLENLGSVTQATISVKGIDVPKETKNIINIELTVEGSFEQVSRTLTLLENIPYQVEVMKIYMNKNIQPNAKDDEKVKTPETSDWQADITFNILSLN